MPRSEGDLRVRITRSVGIAIVIGEESTRVRLMRSGIGPILETVTIGLAGERLPDSSPRVLGGPPEANACRPEGERTWSKVPGTPITSRTARHDSVWRPSRGPGVGGESQRHLAIRIE